MGHKRLEPAPIVPVLQSVDISKLPSGNYFLTVEVRNRAKEKLMQRSVSFQRSNPYLSIELADVDTTSVKEEFAWKLSAEELRFSLKAVAPRLSADAEAINTLLAGDNLQAQRLYLFAYWTKESPNYPEAAYRKYMEVARAVGDMFHSGFGNGVETDRGYIYLKYGRPDDMIKVEDEPSAPPYEIWSYNYFPTTKQNNVRFLFYNPSLSPGNFQLLHSTARGEINNPQWQLRLYRDAPTELNTPNFIDGTDLNDNFGRKAVRYFNDF
jgi:GWxTD domain-containing protein